MKDYGDELTKGPWTPEEVRSYAVYFVWADVMQGSQQTRRTTASTARRARTSPGAREPIDYHRMVNKALYNESNCAPAPLLRRNPALAALPCTYCRMRFCCAVLGSMGLRTGA